MQRYTIKLGFMWLAYDGLFSDLPGTNWTPHRRARRVIRATRREARAYFRYVRTIYPEAKLVRLIKQGNK